MAPTRRVFTTPAPDTKVHPLHTYSEEQTKSIEALQEYTSTLLLPASHPYHFWERRWLSKPDTHPRYMRAAKWNFADAQKRIHATMEWRREFQPDLISPEEVKEEARTGKIILNGFDKDGRPILYMRPGRENTETGPRQLRHLVWWLERGKDFMPPGQESLVILVDYKSCTLRTNPSISVALKVLHILQQHYVETLGRALVVNLPFMLNFFYKGIERFLDPVTRDKLRFNPNLLDLIPEAQLDAAFGGSHEFEFEPEEYWDKIVEICGIAADGTRVLPSPTSNTTTADADKESSLALNGAEEATAALNGLSIEGGSDRASLESGGSDSSYSEVSEDSPVTPNVARSVGSFNSVEKQASTRTEVQVQPVEIAVS